MLSISSLGRSPWRIGGSVAAAALACITVTTVHAAVAKKKVPPKAVAVPPNTSKGQTQVNGGNGQFGVIYTLKNKINFTILSAKYQVTPYPCYSKLYSTDKDKLLILQIAVKNVSTDDNFIGDFGGMISAFDDKQGKYDVGSGEMNLASVGEDSPQTNLKPGQGLGQTGLNDPLSVAIVVNRDAHIVKLILNQGREGRDEDVVRYYMSDATAENAGAAGDPANIIAPLPDWARDPNDKTGSVVPEVMNGGKPGAGVLAVSTNYGATLDSFAYAPADAQFNGNPADDGKRYAVATITLKNVSMVDATVYDAVDTSSTVLTDADGDHYNIVYTRKAHADEDPASDHVIKPGMTYTIRHVFMVPKPVQVKTYTYLAASGHSWIFDVSDIK